MANENESLQPTISYAGDNAMLIPCTPRDFGKFISGLLGSTQAIRRRLRGPYELKKEDIRNIYELVQHRIKRQNDASIVEFAVVTSYSDGSSVRLSSIAEFESYAEVKPLISTDFAMKWKILIKFPGETVPQKQEIEIVFITFREEDDEVVSRNIFFGLEDEFHDSIVIRVEHTDRTWGVDIENMLVGHMGLLMKPDAPWRNVVRRHWRVPSFSLGVVVIFAGIFAVVQSASQVSEKITQLGNYSNYKGENLTIRAIESYTAIAASGAWEKFAVIAASSILVSIVLGVVVSLVTMSALKKAKRSYILFTPRSVSQRDKEEGARKRGVIALTLYVVGSLALSVAGNYAFALAIKIWSP